MLVAGIGNIFLGDDAFGSEVARRLAGRTLPQGVGVRDFGIRAIDLAYALVGETGEAILIDTVSRGGAPGTLYVIDADDPPAEIGAPLAGHDLEPFTALATARNGRNGAHDRRGLRARELRYRRGRRRQDGVEPARCRGVEPAVDLVLSLTSALDIANE